LGLVHLALKPDEPQRAIACHEKALTMMVEIGDRRGEATCLGNLGLAYAVWGDRFAATAFYQKQLQVAREIEDRRGLR
jgi:hypothetical protein